MSKKNWKVIDLTKKVTTEENNWVETITTTTKTTIVENEKEIYEIDTEIEETKRKLNELEASRIQRIKEIEEKEIIEKNRALLEEEIDRITKEQEENKNEIIENSKNEIIILKEEIIDDSEKSKLEKTEIEFIDNSKNKDVEFIDNSNKRKDPLAEIEEEILQEKKKLEENLVKEEDIKKIIEEENEKKTSVITETTETKIKEENTEKTSNFDDLESSYEKEYREEIIKDSKNEIEKNDNKQKSSTSSLLKIMIWILWLLCLIFILCFSNITNKNFEVIKNKFTNVDKQIKDLNQKFEYQEWFNWEVREYVKWVDSFMRDTSLEFDRIQKINDENKKVIERDEKFHKALKEIYFWNEETTVHNDQPTTYTWAITNPNY